MFTWCSKRTRWCWRIEANHSAGVITFSGNKPMSPTDVAMRDSWMSRVTRLNTWYQHCTADDCRSIKPQVFTASVIGIRVGNLRQVFVVRFVGRYGDFAMRYRLTSAMVTLILCGTMALILYRSATLILYRSATLIIFRSTTHVVRPILTLYS